MWDTSVSSATYNGLRVILPFWKTLPDNWTRWTERKEGGLQYVHIIITFNVACPVSDIWKGDNM